MSHDDGCKKYQDSINELEAKFENYARLALARIEELEAAIARWPAYWQKHSGL
jgi:hypothetical protein